MFESSLCMLTMETKEECFKRQQILQRVKLSRKSEKLDSFSLENSCQKRAPQS